MDVYIAQEFLLWWEFRLLKQMYNGVGLVRDATVIPLIDKVRKYIFACDLQISMIHADYQRVDAAERLRLRRTAVYD